MRYCQNLKCTVFKRHCQQNEKTSHRLERKYLQNTKLIKDLNLELLNTNHFCYYLLLLFIIYLFIGTESSSCHPGQSAMAVAQSQLTATSASWVQASLLPQPPK